ncbi:MAG: SCP2 sterol-binding domain-containing protein [Nitrospirota bacterium]|nr:SCP2 sterol-binding domain-containing protein [Nitrospirota bacterium]
MYQFLKFVPQAIQNLGVDLLLGLMMKRNPGIVDRLAQLEGKVFLFDAHDIAKCYFLHVRNGYLTVGPPVEKPDVSMRGEIGTLLSLLRKKADADSAFFMRKLKLEGDVKTSVYFKNVLENIE